PAKVPIATSSSTHFRTLLIASSPERSGKIVADVISGPQGPPLVPIEGYRPPVSQKSPTTAHGVQVGSIEGGSVQPGALGAFDEREGARRAPAAGGVGLGLDAGLGPGVGHAVDPAPGLLDLVAAHE